MFSIVLLVFLSAVVLYALWCIFRPDPMDNLLDDLALRDLVGKMLSVPKYERIVREILDAKDDAK